MQQKLLKNVVSEWVSKNSKSLNLDSAEREKIEIGDGVNLKCYYFVVHLTFTLIVLEKVS